MIGRVRHWLSAPLTDSDRPRLFLAAVAALLAGAGVLTLLVGPRDGPPRRSTAPASRPPRALAAPSIVPPADVAPSDPRPPTAPSPPSRDDVETAKQTARRFLTDYLPYTYGRRSPGQIRAATPGLRRRLATDRPRVPSAARRRRPRVLLVQAEDVSRTHAAVTALIADGAERYTVELELTRDRTGWAVTAVGA